MFDSITPAPLENQLPVDAYWHLVRTLRLTLPPPPDDTPEALTRRDHAAIARVAALAPGDSAEAELAAQFVAASEQWKDCLRLAQSPEMSPEWAAKCRAQALGMMRQANAALRLLQRMQAARAKLGNAEADRRARAEHIATRLMAEALAEMPASDEPAEAPSPQPTPQPAAAEAKRKRPLDPDLIGAAERYAALDPERAAKIRRAKKLPCDARYFDPPEAAVGQATIHGRTPALAALDHATCPAA